MNRCAPSRRTRRCVVSEDALITREQRGNISVLTMVYRPYNLLGPKFLNAIVEQIEEARKLGSRGVVGKNRFGGGNARFASAAWRHPASGATHRRAPRQGDVDACASL